MLHLAIILTSGKINIKVNLQIIATCYMLHIRGNTSPYMVGALVATPLAPLIGMY